jgi:hypothetical protein
LFFVHSVVKELRHKVPKSSKLNEDAATVANVNGDDDDDNDDVDDVVDVADDLFAPAASSSSPPPLRYSSGRPIRRASRSVKYTDEDFRDDDYDEEMDEDYRDDDSDDDEVPAIFRRRRQTKLDCAG